MAIFIECTQDGYVKYRNNNFLSFDDILNEPDKFFVEIEKKDKYISYNGDPFKVDTYFGWYNDDFCFKMVRMDGMLLRYVRTQTDDICIAAVRENAKAIQYVNNITLDLLKLVPSDMYEIKLK